MSEDPKREFLRHTLATRNAPESFADFSVGEGARTPGQILAHIGDLMDWALSIAKGQQTWRDAKPMPWNQEVERLFAALKKFDDFLASSEPLHAPVEKMFQGPIADALTHVGQIAMLRRQARVPVRAENYYVAEMVAGRVGPEQAAPKKEFG
jgi:hypothetical protein